MNYSLKRWPFFKVYLIFRLLLFLFFQFKYIKPRYKLTIQTLFKVQWIPTQPSFHLMLMCRCELSKTFQSSDRWSNCDLPTEMNIFYKMGTESLQREPDHWMVFILEPTHSLACDRSFRQAPRLDRLTIGRPRAIGVKLIVLQRSDFWPTTALNIRVWPFLTEKCCISVEC